MKELIIDGIVVSNDSDCYVTAEIGHNHQGNLDTCMEMFRIARECGAKAVKLQKRDNRALYVKALYNQPYDHRNSYGKTYGEHREFLEFGKNEYLELKRYAEELHVAFICTPFDFPSVDFLAEIFIAGLKPNSGSRLVPITPTVDTQYSQAKYECQSVQAMVQDLVLPC